jgi:hypothetical protein
MIEVARRGPKLFAGAEHVLSHVGLQSARQPSGAIEYERAYELAVPPPKRVGKVADVAGNATLGKVQTLKRLDTDMGPHGSDDSPCRK